MIYICMGVAGSGKTTLGKALAEQLSLPFYDGDDFHPPKNVIKMASGKPLDDDDREPWLEILAKNIALWEQEGGSVLACSALKERYRRHLRQYVNEVVVRFIFLKGDQVTLLPRLQGREGHFFPPELLASQLETLEEPQDAIVIPVELSLEEKLRRIGAAL